jgi:6-phosphofructokinase 1
VLRTSRANPARSAETLQNVAESLERLGASYLLTIGGDDTASGAAADGARAEREARRRTRAEDDRQRSAARRPGVPTFGFMTAVDVGKDLVQNLMKGRGHDRQVVSSSPSWAVTRAISPSVSAVPQARR